MKDAKKKKSKEERDGQKDRQKEGNRRYTKQKIPGPQPNKYQKDILWKTNVGSMLHLPSFQSQYCYTQT